MMRYTYCHPLFEERKCAHRFSYLLAQAFAAAGLSLERFDYTGTGEDTNDFADVSLTSLREDLGKHIAQEVVSLIGLRLGASLAFDYAVHNPETVRRLVLVEPVIDGDAYVEYLSRKQHIKDMMTGGVSSHGETGYVNFEGYRTSMQLVQELRAFDLLQLAGLGATWPPTQMVCISNKSHNNVSLQTFVELARSQDMQISIQTVELPSFWERIPLTDCAGMIETVVGFCHE